MQPYVRDNTNFLTSAIGDETVVMDMSNGNYVGLNSIASHIWALLEKPVSLQDIVNELRSIYDVTEEECLMQSQECISKMLDQKMILEYS